MSAQSEIGLPESVGRTILELRAEELRQKRLARNASVGENIKNSIADLSIEFPWEGDLRRISPIASAYSHLRAYWYRAKARWVLYDVLPSEAIEDEMDTGSGLTGYELRQIMNGVKIEDRDDDVPISPVQQAMWHQWGGYARPFWVLQGEHGGHQVRFSPQQSSALLRMGLPPEPPPLGSLPPCPFDNRAIAQLQHLNRLHQFEDSIERLRKSGSTEFAKAEEARIEQEVREAEMKFVESQVRPLVEMASSLRQRTEMESELVMVEPGLAAKAKDAYDRYKETGEYTFLK